MLGSTWIDENLTKQVEYSPDFSLKIIDEVSEFEACFFLWILLFFIANLSQNSCQQLSESVSRYCHRAQSWIGIAFGDQLDTDAS